MNHRTRWGAGAIVLLLVPAAFVYIWRDAWWPLVLFVLGTAAAAVLFAGLERRRYRDRNARMLEHARVSAIRMLSHHRHDWMNDLQILYGYLRLKKPDKAAEMVDRIRERMENDSRISQLGSAELSTFLLSFRTMCDHMRLDVKVADGVFLDKLPIPTDKLACVLIGMIDVFRYRTAGYTAAENVLHLTFFERNGTLCLELRFEGELAAGGLTTELENLLDGLGQLTEEEHGDLLQGASRKVLVTFPLTA